MDVFFVFFLFLRLNLALQDMFQKWMFFRVTLDMLEMVSAKADPGVVKM